MSAVATPAPVRDVGPVRRLVGSLRPVAGLLRPYRALFFGGVATNLMVHVCTFGAAVAGAVLIGEALEGSPSSELWPLVWVIVVLAVPIALFGWLEVVVVHVMSFRLIDDLRTALYERFRVLSPAYFLSRRSGDVARASMADVELLELFTSHLAPPLVVALVIPVFAEIGLWIVEPILAVVVLPFVVAAASVPSWLLGRAQDEGERLRDELGQLGANVVDVVQGTREVLAASGEEVMLDRIERQHERIRATSISHGRRSGIEHAATDAITSLAAITVVTTTAVLATNGSFDTASIPVALILAAGAFAPLASLTGTFREVGQVSAAAERIEALMAAQPLVTDRVDVSASAVRPPEVGRPLRVAFEGVSFRYDEDLPDALADVAFTVEAGERIALVGRSGAGKSTCANLLLRLWDVREGAVTVGGTDVRDLTQRDLRSLIAVVPQDVYLFHASVAENLRLGDPDASDESVRAAAALAQADAFIERLPDGYDSVLGERGASISGGQRQRLAIARALLRRAPILVMDEAVANLDAESEAALQAAMAAVARDRTTLLIAHRPSTIRTADRVVVLDQGRVVEAGPFDDLMAAGGPLATLLASASAVIDPDTVSDI